VGLVLLYGAALSWFSSLAAADLGLSFGPADLAQAAGADLELITASPEANGFFGSAGASGYIPLAYSLLEQRTWRRLTRQQRRRGGGNGDGGGGAGQAGLADAMDPHSKAAAAAASQRQVLLGRRRLEEYCRPGWEFHAKGLWVTLPNAQCGSMRHAAGAGSLAAAPAPAAAIAAPAARAGPVVTAVGSSNFGFRSLRRDLEVQFLVITKNRGLQQVSIGGMAGDRVVAVFVQPQLPLLRSRLLPAISTHTAMQPPPRPSCCRRWAMRWRSCGSTARRWRGRPTF
jgi:hypothetical protein